MPTVEDPTQAGQTAREALNARLIRRTFSQWPVIVGCAVVGLIAAYLVAHSRPAMYRATTVVQLNPVDLGSVFLQTNLQQQGDDTVTKTATSAQIVTLPRVRQLAAQALGGRVTQAEIEKAISVDPRISTTLVDISATYKDPKLAAQIADATRVAFMTVRSEASLSQLNAASSDVQKQLSAIPASQSGSTAAKTLRDRLEQIDTLRLVANGGVDTLQPAQVPTTTVSPRPKRDAILGLFVGGLFGLIFALGRARFDNRVRDAAELTEMWDLPILGLIPETKDLSSKNREHPSPAALEAFALARTSLRYLHVGGEVKTVLVTSALAGEGKSTVAWNLAVAAAMAETKVLVIEADLRRPVLAERLELHASDGMSEVLAGIVPLESAVVRTSAAQSVGGPSVDIDVLLAGMVPPSPIALLERAGTARLIESARDKYDLVIVDSPPATVVADAQVLLGHVDGVVVVSRLGEARRAAFTRLRDLLSGSSTPVLGVVVNGGASSKSYGYSTYTSSSSGGTQAQTPPVAPSAPRPNKTPV